MCAACGAKMYYDWETKFVYVGKRKGPGGGDYRGMRRVNGKWVDVEARR